MAGFISSGNLVKDGLLRLSEAELLKATQQSYDVPSLAAWRAAELRVLRRLAFAPPLLEIGCGSGLFSSLLFQNVDCGVDRNPREIDVCSQRTGIYRKLACMDARSLDFPDGSFATVFANCVIEYIPGLDRVLNECRRVLWPGGRMIATVPLREMNRYLLVPLRAYAGLRARQLQHVNLLGEREWIDAFRRAGFDDVASTPYLPGSLCRLWDRVDGPICLGAGRFTLGNLYRGSLRLLPGAARTRIDSFWARYFEPSLGEDPSREPAAIVVEARRPVA